MKEDPYAAPGDRAVVSRPLAIGLFVCACLVISFCANLLSENPDLARSRGASEGDNEGSRAGYAAGYVSAFKIAESNSYQARLDSAVADGSFHKDFDLGFLTIVAGVATGFILQYALFFVLRWIGMLGDVDSLLLPQSRPEDFLDDEQPLQSSFPDSINTRPFS